MSERRALLSQRKLLELRQLVEAEASINLAEAQLREHDLRATQRNLEVQVHEAQIDWSTHLATHVLDTHQLQRLAEVVTRSYQDLQKVNVSVDTAANQTALRQNEFAQADIQTRQAEKIVHDHAKELSNRREETAARKLEDRIAFAWRAQ